MAGSTTFETGLIDNILLDKANNNNEVKRHRWESTRDKEQRKKNLNS